MSRHHRSRKRGQPPGSLIYVGRSDAKPPAVTVIDYGPDTYSARRLTDPGTLFGLADPPGLRWIDIEGVGDPHFLEALGARYGIHPLVLEDVLATEQRPKVDDLEKYLYVVVKMVRPGRVEGKLSGEQLSLILSERQVISIQEGVLGDSFDPIRRRIEGGKGRTRKMGSDYLLYALLDGIVDDYFEVLEQIGEEIETLEDAVVAGPDRETVPRIHCLKRDLIQLRRVVWPLREVLSRLERRESPLITQGTQIFFRDIYDHLVQIMDGIESGREMLSSLLDIYLSSISNRMNQVMKVLTIISTIFIPLTFLAGIYGMNFQFMPELGWRWSYPLLWGVMIALAAVMLALFRRKGWF